MTSTPRKPPPVGTLLKVDFEEIYELISIHTDFETPCLLGLFGCSAHGWRTSDADEFAKGCPNVRQRRVLASLEAVR